MGLASAQRRNLLESVPWANPWVFRVCPYPQSRPSSGAGISAIAPGASSLLTEDEGSR